MPEPNDEPPSGFNWWRRTLSYKTGLGLTQEEKVKYENDLKLKKSKDDCTRCYEYRDWMLRYSPTVKFLMDQISQAGGQISAKDIVCDECDDLKGGGFHPEIGILICQNRLIDKWHLEDIVSHELIHAYDNTKFKVDWFNLRHHACSEIRASSLSGECRIMQQFWRSSISRFNSGHQDCVRRRAVLSLQANPNCKDKDQAQSIVDEVFESCFNDTRPFEMIYR
ncbi:BA75_00499T0 [Komagataella pastoris]|uniref:Mitochondrial inner membrane protease ATP23 n=1 Tax=Komagataella pastoris TaxID=4922 RepID=A0A1B2J8V6_PICPA|nr:BA75_00499T0 [Komagataella pastoris]